MTGPNLGGATVMVAPLGANPVDPAEWTNLGYVSDGFSLVDETDETWLNEWSTDSVSGTRRTWTVSAGFLLPEPPEPQFPSCVHPGFTAALTQKGDTDGLPPGRD